MSESELKREIQNLVEQESNIDVLKNIKELLNEQKLKEVLISRAIKSQADIEAGRVYTTEEVKQRFNLP